MLLAIFRSEKIQTLIQVKRRNEKKRTFDHKARPIRHLNASARWFLARKSERLSGVLKVGRIISKKGATKRDKGARETAGEMK